MAFVRAVMATRVIVFAAPVAVTGKYRYASPGKKVTEPDVVAPLGCVTE
jgi:hypothetical protein